jgi:hypothetical protein
MTGSVYCIIGVTGCVKSVFFCCPLVLVSPVHIHSPLSPWPGLSLSLLARVKLHVPASNYILYKARTRVQYDTIQHVMTSYMYVYMICTFIQHYIEFGAFWMSNRFFH